MNKGNATFDEVQTLPLFVRQLLARLEKEIPPNLRYHKLEHSLEVLKDSLMLARAENLVQREIELLSIAACFHDAGYLDSAKRHEKKSASMARQAMLEAGGFEEEEVALVCQVILDTEIVKTEGGLIQRPRSKISPILLDADLANFGKESFLEITELIRLEKNQPRSKSFYVAVEKLLSGHRWLTATAQKKWQKQKEENQRKLRALIESLPE